MIDKIEETVDENEAENWFCKTPGLNNPETYVLTHNRFNTCLVLIFSESNKAQIYKKPFRDSPHDKIEINMSFILFEFV